MDVVQRWSERIAQRVAPAEVDFAAEVRAAYAAGIRGPFQSLRSRLASAGFKQERADQLAYELLEELLTDAAEAVVFVEALSAVPRGGARASRP